jgi:hypothetical protein
VFHSLAPVRGWHSPVNPLIAPVLCYNDSVQRLRVVAVFMLGLIPAFPQSAPDSKADALCGQSASIDAYSARLDATLESLSNKRFGTSFSGGRWRAVGDTHEGPIARVFLQNGKPVVTVLVLSTESGDWILEVTYYYRANGTLAKKHELLNTFYGHASVVKESMYDCSGLLMSKKVRHRDLTTKEEKAPDPEFVDESSPDYKRIQQWPFYDLLQGSRRK